MEKRIKLTDDQLVRIVRAYRELKVVPDMVASMVTTIMEEYVQRDKEFWDQIARLAGYENHLDVKRHGCKISVGFVSGELVVREENK